MKRLAGLTVHAEAVAPNCPGSLAVDPAGDGASAAICTYPYQTLVSFTLSGLITAHNGSTTAFTSGPAGHRENSQCNGAWGAGFFDAGGNRYVAIPPDCAPPAGGYGTGSYSGFAIVQGAGTFNRTGFTDPGYTFTGGPSKMTMKPVQATATLTSDATGAVAPGTFVTFTINITPTSAGGIGIPYSVPSPSSWVYSGSTPNTCGSGTTCLIQVNTSGTMTVEAIVNGTTTPVSAHVTVHCPTGDSLLDNHPVTEGGLDAAWISGNGNNADLSKRQEEGGTEYPTGMQFGLDTSLFHSSGDTPCTSVEHVEGPGSIYFHTHVIQPGEQFPLNCPSGFTGKALPGPSRTYDIPNLPSGGTGVIIDSLSVYIYGSSGLQRTLPRHQPSGCAYP